MPKYIVNVKENYLHIYEVEAESYVDALAKCHTYKPNETAMISREVINCYPARSTQEEDITRTLEKMEIGEKKPN